MSLYTGQAPDTPRAEDWRDQAACSGQAPDTWFPPPSDTAGIAAAKGVCFGCPVMVQCAQYALTHRLDGVWGGLTEQQRATLVRRRRAHQMALDELRPVVLGALRDEMYPLDLPSLWELYTEHLPGGHVRWTGPREIPLEGRRYTKNGIAFLYSRGRPPVGYATRMRACRVQGCCAPSHLEDARERQERAQALRAADTAGAVEEAAA